MKELETFLYGIVLFAGFFLLNKFIKNWFGSEEDEEDYYEDQNKKYVQLQDQALNSISTISENKKLVEKSSEIHHHHYKTENHYHVYKDGNEVRSEKFVNRRFIGSDV
jgi:hypothetical protein